MTIPAEHLETLDPLAAACYLQLKGWDLVRSGELGDKWQLSSLNGRRNVAVPRGELDSHDRASMFSAVLQVLTEVEQRSASEILGDLRFADCDLVRFRIESADLHDGEIPLLAAPDMLQGALDAIGAAGRAEIQRRAVYSGGPLPSQVKSFIDSARVAPAEKGSVILNIRSRIGRDSIRQTSMLPDSQRPAADVPFSRKALQRLISATRSAKSATRLESARLSEPDALDEEIESGLSANLCDAIGHLAGSQTELDATVTVGVRWSLFMPSDEPVSSVELMRGELQSLASVATTLRAIQPRFDHPVSGFVRHLDRLPGEPFGNVRVQTDIDGRLATVKLGLSESDYEMAVQAHLTNRELRFVSTLEKAGRMWEAINPSDVQVLGSRPGE